MTTSRPRAPMGRPASAGTPILIVAAVLLVGAVTVALVSSRSRRDEPRRPERPTAAPATAPAAARPDALPEKATGIAACDEMIGIIRCAQPLLPEEKQDEILKGGRMIVRAIGKVQRLGQQVPELTGELAAACREGTTQLRAALSSVPALAGCFKAAR